MTALFSRRVVLAGVPLIIIGGTCSHAQEPTADADGCWVPKGKAGDLIAKAGKIEAFSYGSETLEPRSGNQQLDRALAMGLATIAKTFGILPGFAYYQEDHGVNAKATPEALLERTDGTVMFGLSMLKKLLGTPRPDAAILAVCSHEFGHIVSYKNGMIDKLAPNNSEPFRAEQFADFMAGYFAGTRKLIHQNYPAVVFATTQNAFGGGDHGSGAQRGEAVQTGFLAAFQQKLKLDAAVQAGYDFAIARVL